VTVTSNQSNNSNRSNDEDPNGCFESDDFINNDVQEALKVIFLIFVINEFPNLRKFINNHENPLKKNIIPLRS
jgi:hypothetical protein